MNIVTSRLCPGDFTDVFPGLDEFRRLFNLPEELTAERSSNVSHSFGSKTSEADGSRGVYLVLIIVYLDYVQFLTEVLVVWAHFVAARPPAGSNFRHAWIKSGVFLRWEEICPDATGSQNPGPSTEVIPTKTFRVTFIIFDTPVTFIKRTLRSLKPRNSWKTAVAEPLWLLAEFFRSWHQTVDEAAWGVTRLANEVELMAFEQAKEPPDHTKPPGVKIPLMRPHIVAKNALYNLEALNSALRALGKAIAYHRTVQKEMAPPRWQATGESLEYTEELFLSTRHRMLSVDSRMKNVISLVRLIRLERRVGSFRVPRLLTLCPAQNFHLQAMHDSAIMQSDSRELKEHSKTMSADSRVLRNHSKTMRATSLLAMTLLPFSTVVTVFGTQFFDSSGPSGDSGQPLRFEMNPKIWVMFAIAIPLTATVLGWWYFWVERSEREDPPGTAIRADERGAALAGTRSDGLGHV